jgi:DNA adenine methylase
MNSFIPWVGGKKLLRKAIYEYFPKVESGGKNKPTFDRCIEVFGGAAWLLFYKDCHAPFEVYNDVNGELVNLFRCVKAHPHELAREIDLNLISRERFLDYTNQDPQYLTDIQRAARFMYMIKYSFCSKTTSFGANNRLLPSLELMREVAQRLGQVIIENNSYERIIKQYDRPNSLFYLDPPYYTTEKYYNIGKTNFGHDDHVKLRDMLSDIKGKFILSYNDDEFLRELYKDFNIHAISRHNNMTTHTGKAGKFKELIITNY